MFTKIKEFFLGKPKTVEPTVEVPYKVETPVTEAKPAPVAKAKPAPAKKAPAPKTPRARPAPAAKPQASKPARAKKPTA